MDTFLKADVFFFVATVAIVLVTAGLIFIIVYVIRILKDMRYVSRRVREKSDEIIADVDAFRESLKAKRTWRPAFGPLLARFFRKRKSGKAAQDKDAEE